MSIQYDRLSEYKMPKMQIISIEGNIGSGKTTLLTNLKTFYNKNNNIHIIFLREPVDEWENIKDKYGNTMVQNFIWTKRNILLVSR